MSTKQNTETLYDLTAVDDMAAWDTHEIRHHARKHRNPIHRGLGILTLLFAAGSLLSAASIGHQPEPPRNAPEIPLSVQQYRGVPDTTTDTTDDRTLLRASRDEARKPPAPEVPKAEPNKIEQVIAWAMAQQGKKYVFGSAGPNSFDCSGLVMRAFEQVGIKLPHFTGTMIKYGTKIPRSQLQRGDILFPTSGHVVIYLGNGMQLAASSGKGRVTVQKVTSFYAARRLV